MHNLRIVAGPDEEILPSANEKLLARKADLVSAVERLRQKRVSLYEVDGLLRDLRNSLSHTSDPLFRTMSAITSLDEINTLESKLDIHFVYEGIASLKKCGHWPFLPEAAQKTGGKKAVMSIMRKVQSVVPMISGGWKSLGITNDELRRCATLMPYLGKRHMVSLALFNIVEMSKLYPDITQSDLAKGKHPPAEATAYVNELRYRVSQGEFTFAELYTTEARLEKTLRHINKALSKLAP